VYYLPAVVNLPSLCPINRNFWVNDALPFPGSIQSTTT
jgi:hypothetical protein